MSFAFAGEHDLTKREGLEFTSRVRHFGYTTHNSYNEQKTQGVIEYDIAVLELEKPVDFTDFKHIRYRWVYGSGLSIKETDHKSRYNGVQVSKNLTLPCTVDTVSIQCLPVSGYPMLNICFPSVHCTVGGFKRSGVKFYYGYLFNF